MDEGAVVGSALVPWQKRQRGGPLEFCLT